MTASTPRRRKTPQQRAEEALGVAERRVTTLQKQRNRLEDDLDVVRAELAEATARRDYAAIDPALQGSSTATPVRTLTTQENA